MSDKKKVKYLTKSIRFGTKEMTLFSIDGTTWSSRKDELLTILERHEAERLKLLASMGETKLEVAEEAAAPAEKESDDGPVIISDDDTEDTERGSKKSQKVTAIGNNAKANAAKAAQAGKGGKGKAAPKSRDRVAFVSPKPRQVAKQRKKTAAKGKRKAA